MRFDDKAERVQLSLLGPSILETLQQPENSDPIHHQTKWRPEYAAFMIEGKEEERGKFSLSAGL